MDRKNPIRPFRCWKEVLYALMFLLIIAGTPFNQDAWAQQTVTVKVLVEEACANGCDVADLKANLYWDVFIDDNKVSSIADPVPVMICPISPGKEFSHNVDGSKTSIHVDIEQYNKTDLPLVGNVQCDIDPTGGYALNLDLDVSTYPCKISGNVSGTCGESIFINSGGGYFRFTINVDYPCEGERCVRCLHDPIWPQPGDPVTIRVEPVDAKGESTSVDELQIWVDDDTAPKCSSAMSPLCSFYENTGTFSYTPPEGADQISYRCTARKNGVWASTGWRRTQIGDPPRGRAVPVVYSAVPDSGVDIAFIPDIDDYQGPRDPQFLTDVYNIIRDIYYGRDPDVRAGGGHFFLYKQNYMNFWIAMDGGDAEEYSEANPIPTVPATWKTDYGFIESGIIVHKHAFANERAYRGMRIITAAMDKRASFLHELGHCPFGLADEYYDAGDVGFWEANPFPNIYNNQERCKADPVAIGVSDACQPIKDDYSDNWVDWYRVEPASTLLNEIMRETGTKAVNKADENRINWYFGQCQSGGC